MLQHQRRLQRVHLQLHLCQSLRQAQQCPPRLQSQRQLAELALGRGRDDQLYLGSGGARRFAELDEPSVAYGGFDLPCVKEAVWRTEEATHTFFADLLEQLESSQRQVVEVYRAYFLEELGYPEDLPLLELGASLSQAPPLLLLAAQNKAIVAWRNANMRWATCGMSQERRSRVNRDIARKFNEALVKRHGEGREYALLHALSRVLLAAAEEDFKDPGWLREILKKTPAERAAAVKAEKESILAEVRGAASTREEVRRAVREELRRSGAGADDDAESRGSRRGRRGGRASNSTGGGDGGSVDGDGSTRTSGSRTPSPRPKPVCSRCGRRHDGTPAACWSTTHVDGTVLGANPSGAKAPERRTDGGSTVSGLTTDAGSAGDSRA